MSTRRGLVGTGTRVGREVVGEMSGMAMGDSYVVEPGKRFS
ncbi:hypothetical protein [Nonomuraea dietziae]